MMKTVTISLTCFFTFGIHLICQGQPSQLAIKDILTEQDAQVRKEHIKSANYDLEFRFQKNAEGFKGTTKIEVELNSSKIPLRIDSTVTEIKEIPINGQQIHDFTSHVGFLEISQEHLQTKNEIIVKYYRKYSRKDSSLYYFVDPVDEKEYLFINSEPYGAHTFFPCFDQPDLKARFDVTQVIPKEWIAISNNPVETTEEVTDYKIIRFKRTPPLSTYLLFIGAGDYKAWHSKADNIPVTLYARQSMANYVEAETAEAIFDITQKHHGSISHVAGRPFNPFHV
jgi:aminopeptidase N